MPVSHPISQLQLPKKENQFGLNSHKRCSLVRAFGSGSSQVSDLQIDSPWVKCPPLDQSTVTNGEDGRGEGQIKQSTGMTWNLTSQQEFWVPSFVWRGLWECPAQTGLSSGELIQKLKEHNVYSKAPWAPEPKIDYFLNYTPDTTSAKPLYK